MASRDPFLRSVLPPSAVLLIVFAVGLTTGTSLQPSPTEFPPVSDADSQTGGGTAISPAEKEPFAVRWREVDRLVEDDRMAAAYEIVEEILAAAIETGEEEQWTRALIRSVQLRTALHGYETAVRLLQEQPLPETPGSARSWSSSTPMDWSPICVSTHGRSRSASRWKARPR